MLHGLAGHCPAQIEVNHTLNELLQKSRFTSQTFSSSTNIFSTAKPSASMKIKFGNSCSAKTLLQSLQIYIKNVFILYLIMHFQL